MPLPEWFRSEVKSFELPKTLPYKRIASLEIPSRTFTRKFTVTVSDTDLNLHLNQAVFVRFAFDCAWEACNDGFLQGYSGDLCGYEIAEENITYMSEVLLGETVTVHVWEMENDRRIHSVVCKENGKDSCYVNFKFLPDHMSFEVESKL